MKAVNLIPTDSGPAGPRAPRDVQVLVYATLGVLAIGIVLMALYVLGGNTIANRQAQITVLKEQVAQTQSRLGQLTGYVKFQQLAETRMQTVKQIAGARFDWAGALGELSHVVPTNTTLQTVSASLSADSSSGSSGLRSAETGPAFELSGCTHNQIDVARLMSRLRTMPDVTRVTLTSSQSTQASGSGPAPSSSSSSGSGDSIGCGSGPSFDMLVFFSAPAGSAPTGASAAASAATAPTTTTSTTPTPAGATTTPATTTPAGATTAPATGTTAPTSTTTTPAGGSR